MALYGGCSSSDEALKRVGFAIFRSLTLVGLVAPSSFEAFDVSWGCGILNRLQPGVSALVWGGLNRV